jgi:hypothetical protein
MVNLDIDIGTVVDEQKNELFESVKRLVKPRK